MAVGQRQILCSNLTLDIKLNPGCFFSFSPFFKRADFLFFFFFLKGGKGGGGVSGLMKRILPQAQRKLNQKEGCLSWSSLQSCRARRDFAKSQQLRGDMRRLQQETSRAALSCLPAFSRCSQTPVLASLLSRTKQRSSSAAAWCFSSFLCL